MRGKGGTAFSFTTHGHACFHSHSSKLNMFKSLTFFSDYFPDIIGQGIKDVYIKMVISV